MPAKKTKSRAPKGKPKSRPKPAAAARAAKPAAKRAPKTSAKSARPAAVPKAERVPGGDKLSFNHAMVYCRDVARELEFYRDILGLKLLDEFRFEGKPVYTRLRAPGGDGTIALHQAGPGAPVAADGVRLYFEIQDLDGFCQQLKRKGIYFSQLPQMMPWGWRHAYLNDVDGHEISLYWAGPNRMKKTVMTAGAQAKRNA